MEKRTAFNFYRSYYDVLEDIHRDEDKLTYLLALLDKQFKGIEPSLEGIPKLVYNGQKHSIDKQVEGWENKKGIKLTTTEPPTKDPYQPPTEPPYEPPTEDPSYPPSNDGVMTTEGGSEGGYEDPYLQEQEKGKEKGKEEVKEQLERKIVKADWTWTDKDYRNAWNKDYIVMYDGEVVEEGDLEISF